MPISIDELVTLYPLAYHMAERDSLPQIAQHGLMSTTAILDLIGLSGPKRDSLESNVRREMAPLKHPEFGHFALRDQKPLSASKLAGCLQDGLTVEDWLRLINRKVFFWVQREKVENLVAAKEYKDREHIVLEVDTRTLVTEYFDNVTLAAMNTGTTNPIAHPRGSSTISPLSDFPFEDRRRRRLQIGVELCVDYRVPNVLSHVRTLYVGSESRGLVANDELLRCAKNS